MQDLTPNIQDLTPNIKATRSAGSAGVIIGYRPAGVGSSAERISDFTRIKADRHGVTAGVAQGVLLYSSDSPDSAGLISLMTLPFTGSWPETLLA